MCGMLGFRTDWLAACFWLITGAVFLVTAMENARAESNASAQSAAKLRERRTSAMDLEVGGDLLGLPAGTTRYIIRDDLLALPQVTFKVTDDPNFTGPTQGRGVLLEELARELGAAPAPDLVVAICDDKYRANYPREYLTQHHPVLVLEVNGKPPSGWPKDSGGHEFDMSQSECGRRTEILGAVGGVVRDCSRVAGMVRGICTQSEIQEPTGADAG
jgi:hypothetical protein